MNNGRAVKVVHVDDDYLASGAHKGPNGGLVLWHEGADFLSCGITVGNAISNTEDDSSGLITVVTEDKITCTLTGGTNNTWTLADTYEIFKTAAEDTFISSINTDRRFGRKVVKGDMLTGKGFFPEDVDLDENSEDVFGPGQPEYNHE